MISFWSTFWLDLMSFIVASWFLIGAFTGNFYTGGRGGGIRLVASTKSRLARLISLLIGVGIVSWVIVDIGHKLHV
jgi:hypothetical protein